MRHFYYIVLAEKDGRKHAFGAEIGAHHNLVSCFKRYTNAKIIEPTRTGKEAQAEAARWNSIFKAEGTYDDTLY